MTGAFYGTLASSASVFVAILSALLVNNYVQIRSEKHQTIAELERASEKFGELEMKRTELQGTVDDLVEKREASYRRKAEERVGSYLNSYLALKHSTPIERLTVDELYQSLASYHSYESPQELEESDSTHHHREVLEERFDKIKTLVLEEMVGEFAETHRGKGPEEIEDGIQGDEQTDVDDGEWEFSEEGSGDEVDVEVLSDFDDEKLELKEFIQMYKEKYDLDELHAETRDLLGQKYDSVVDVSSLRAATQIASDIRDAGVDLDPPSVFSDSHSVVGLSEIEQQQLVDVRKELRDVENQISTLRRRKSRLERKKEGLNPEYLMPVLTANVITIILSVVVPVFTYLLVATGSTIPLPSRLALLSHTPVNAFLLWLAGLAVVFDSIHGRLNERDPKTHAMYDWAQKKKEKMCE
ncbi:hypothetical protein [Halorubrum sp. GN12_10-3_MGM]|uniref:hypothetical protein n=1 Tax=Halorubrum sp. GN12_10-3_MGM TaxID=2518113 RepID=UPI0010F84704|nr:hypothetical protein [Halorubrum sp. GN12_10-3_MGM]TKX64321.1 hypothetical protein EXE47_11390 [Halorubrum sp. GN12_10-3_MGM]